MEHLYIPVPRTTRTSKGLICMAAVVDLCLNRQAINYPWTWCSSFYHKSSYLTFTLWWTIGDLLVVVHLTLAHTPEQPGIEPPNLWLVEGLLYMLSYSHATYYQNVLNWGITSFLRSSIQLPISNIQFLQHGYFEFPIFCYMVRFWLFWYPVFWFLFVFWAPSGPTSLCSLCCLVHNVIVGCSLPVVMLCLLSPVSSV